MASEAPPHQPLPANEAGARLPRSLATLSLSRLRDIGAIALAAGILSQVLGPKMPAHAPTRAEALVRELGLRGITAAPADVVWIDPAKGVMGALGAVSRAVVRGLPDPAEPADIYIVETKLSPEGVLLSVGDAHNITETSGADESRPVVRGERFVYVARPLVQGASQTVHVVDAHGRDIPENAGWTRMERLQTKVTNYQETGQSAGLAERVFAIESGSIAKAGENGENGEAGVRVSADLQGEDLLVHAGAERALVPLREAATLPAWIRAEPSELSRPPTLVQWSVDRVRAIPWIGDDKMQTIKAIAFTLLDFAMRNKEEMTGDTGAEDIAKELGQSQLEAPTRTIPVDPEIGWPPPPLEPWVQPELPGEGQWNPQDKDSVIRVAPGLPPAILTTFIRSDRTRKATRVYVALWDPRQIELHMMAGTAEPKTATGETGPGLIPRTPEVLKRVVAASNAGFQALHGEFGMMADGVVYLPPKPYGATVAVERNGTTLFGSWPDDQRVPENIVSYRQNMTVMVLDEKFNPYKRTWWGGTPPGWADKTHTVRTGICLTREKFIAYFYGADISPEALSQAMIQTRCIYGIALDMNAGHSGLEFYKVAPAAEWEPLGRPLEGSIEAEGDVSGIEGWKFRGRRFIRGMGLMNFPRYIRREGRDFFYMTLRQMLPGPPLVMGSAPTPAPAATGSAAATNTASPASSGAPAPTGEGEWRLKGLPQHGFPYALASTEVQPAPGKKVRVLKVDPRLITSDSGPAKGFGAQAPQATGAPSVEKASPKTVFVIDAGEKPSGESAASLWHSPGAFSIGADSPVAEAKRLASGATSPAGAVAALGITDEDGMLVYAEAASATPVDPKLLAEVLTKAGCSQKLFLTKPLDLALGGDTSVAGEAKHAPSGASAVKMFRKEAPGAGTFLESTPIVPFDVWYPLQAKRIRYFKKPKSADPDEAQ